MKEHIPFFGIYDPDMEDMEAYLRGQLQLQKEMIAKLQSDAKYWREMFEKAMSMTEDKK